MTTITAQRPVTPRQEAYLLSLADKKFDGGRQAFSEQVVDPLTATGEWGFSVASKMIDALIAAPDSETAIEPVDVGLYERDGVIYKVQPNQQRTRTYVKRLIPESGDWSYLGMAPLKFLTEDDALTSERAAELGHALEMCVNCAKDLTDERSLLVGYGATCARNNGWPYPTMKEARASQLARIAKETT